MCRFLPIGLLCILVLSVVFPVAAQPTVDRDFVLGEVKTLSSDAFQGRASGTPGGIAARDHIVKVYKSIGIKPFSKFLQPFSFMGAKGKMVEGFNIVGYLPGQKKPESYIVVSAHYDHLGIRNGEIYNGADDNASGVGALLSTALYFRRHPPTHSIIFVAFDAEELGLKGSLAFVSHPPVALGKIYLNVNFDMVSRNIHNELYAAGTTPFPVLKKYLEAVAARSDVKLMLGHDRPELGHDDWTTQSDQGAFFEAGIPFVYFGVEDHPDYHKPTDDFARIMPDFYIHAVETVIDAVSTLDENLEQIHTVSSRGSR